MSSTNFPFSSPSVKEGQPEPEKKQKLESNDEDGEIDLFDDETMRKMLDDEEKNEENNDDRADGDYSDDDRDLTDEEFKQYCAAVNASDGFDVPYFPGVSCCCLIKPHILNDYYRENLKPLCVAALKDYNEKKNTNYEFLKLEKANTQCARGMLYYLTFVGRIPKDNTTQIFEARVLGGFGDYGPEVCSCREKTAPSTTDV